MERRMMLATTLLALALPGCIFLEVPPCDGDCGGPVVVDGCYDDGDCAWGYVCGGDGTCYADSGCWSDRDCAWGYTCGSDGLCYSSGCRADADCAWGDVCGSDGACYPAAPACRDDRDCAPG
jgi:hypothetical protein